MVSIQESTLPKINKINNFDFLRLLFAYFIIISHSYPLSGSTDTEWLSEITKGQIDFAFIGLKGFFSISGYLIFQSLERSKGFIDYYWKRILRLFPALFVVLLLTVLLAPLVYENTIPYLSNKNVWTYIPNNIFLYTIQFGITGVFENIPFKSAINGSLWSIPYEFTLYIIISSFIFLKKFPQIKKALLILLFTFLAVGNIFFYAELSRYFLFVSSGYLLDLGIYFIAGSLLASINIESYTYKNHLFLVSVIVLIVSIATNSFTYSKYFILPICIIIGGIMSTPVINKIGSTIGDLSYGIYIYSFPIQQTLVYYFKFSALELMLPTLFIASFFAYFSWHWIEKRALLLKNYQFNIFSK